jgi:hypothetical protein
MNTLSKIGNLMLVEVNKQDDSIFNGDNLYKSPEGKIFKNFYDSPLEILREGHKWIEPIIICDDEIKVGDKVIGIRKSDNFITKLQDIMNNSQIVIAKQSGTFIYKKVLVQPHQFSLEFIQAVINGKVKDGDKVEIEMQAMYEVGGIEGGEPVDYILKFRKDSTAIIHPYKESI